MGPISTSEDVESSLCPDWQITNQDNNLYWDLLSYSQWSMIVMKLLWETFTFTHWASPLSYIMLGERPTLNILQRLKKQEDLQLTAPTGQNTLYLLLLNDIRAIPGGRREMKDDLKERFKARTRMARMYNIALQTSWNIGTTSSTIGEPILYLCISQPR